MLGYGCVAAPAEEDVAVGEPLKVPLAYGEDSAVGRYVAFEERRLVRRVVDADEHGGGVACSVAEAIGSVIEQRDNGGGAVLRNESSVMLHGEVEVFQGKGGLLAAKFPYDAAVQMGDFVDGAGVPGRNQVVPFRVLVN